MAALWDAHLAVPFPEGLKWIDAPSGDPVSYVDVLLAGCIRSFIGRHGTLDLWRWLTLTDCARHVRELSVPAFRGNAGHIARVRQAADLIVRHGRVAIAPGVVGDAAEAERFEGQEMLWKRKSELDQPLRAALADAMPAGAALGFGIEDDRAWVIVSEPGDTRQALQAAQDSLGRG
ncbi:hypothetical protein ACQEU3_43020 [Spirillospora sp. CA-253888]